MTTTPVSPSRTRRTIVVWSVRVVLGVALGFGARVIWERHPRVRFAAGLTLRALEGDSSSSRAGKRGSHLQDGVPVRFSLDEITTAADPAAALTQWCNAFIAASPDARERCLTTPVAASASALRKFLTQLATQPALRVALDHLFTTLNEGGLYSPSTETMARSFTELARLDPGLALDGAEASGSEEIKSAVWSIIAEDDPQRVIDLAASGAAPRDVVDEALASLAARSPEAADAALERLPEALQQAALTAIVGALAATDPVKALSYALDASGHPDAEWTYLLTREIPITKARDFLLAIEKDHPDMITSGHTGVLELVARLAQRDPAVALQTLDLVGGQAGRSNAMDQILSVAANHDRAATIDSISKWPDGRAKEYAADAIASRWLIEDAPAALQWLGVTTGSGPAFTALPVATESIIDDVLQRAPAESIPDVVKWLAGQSIPNESDSKSQRRALTIFTRRWSHTDPAAAYAWAAALPDAETRTAAAASALGGWLRHDDGTAAYDVLSGQAARDPSLLLATATQGDMDRDPRLSQLVLDHLPALCTQADADGGTANNLERYLLTLLASDTGTNDHVLTAISQLPDPAWQQLLLQRLAPTLRNNPAAVRRIADAMPDREAGSRLMEQAVASMFR